MNSWYLRAIRLLISYILRSILQYWCEHTPHENRNKVRNEQAIWQILAAAVKESLGKFSAVPSIDFDTVDMPDIPAFEQAAPVESPKVHYNSDYNPFKSSASYSPSQRELGKPLWRTSEGGRIRARYDRSFFRCCTHRKCGNRIRVLVGL